MRKILVLAANPQESSAQRLDEQMREIESGLRRANKRDEFALVQKWAVRPRDIQQAMLDESPQIVHFMGQGTKDQGLIFEDATGQPKQIEGAALAGLFALFAEQVNCVVLNGCYSQGQPEAIAQHIPYVVGMSQAIGDQAAIEFAVGFYGALGAGRSIEFAHKFGCNAIQMAGCAEYSAPVLIAQKKETTDSSSTGGSAAGPTTGTNQRPGMVLTAGERRRLETTASELQDQYDALSEKIQFLKQSAQVDDLSPTAAFRLKKQIEAAEEMRGKVGGELSEVEAALGGT